MIDYEIIVIGGGLAGLSAALRLREKKHRVLVIEKNNYPNHKVCGEYVSNEVLPYLKHLGVHFAPKDTVSINRLALSVRGGKSIEMQLPMGGFGISRFALDNLLYKTAKQKGIEFKFDSVIEVSFQENQFSVTTKKGTILSASVVIGAYGKRSLLDKKLERNFAQQKSNWVGVKCHYQQDDFPSDLVALHNFKGGYGGLSKTEDGSVNFCYLASYTSFQREGSVDAFNENVVAENPNMRHFFNKARSKFEKPLAIAQISFDKKPVVENHILMAGDSAGLIHPLCGNGMAMAIHGGKIAADCTHAFLKEPTFTRSQLETQYIKMWNSQFQKRVWMGRRIQALLLSDTLSQIGMSSFARSKSLLKHLISSTHGNPIQV